MSCPFLHNYEQIITLEKATGGERLLHPNSFMNDVNAVIIEQFSKRRRVIFIWNFTKKNLDCDLFT